MTRAGAEAIAAQGGEAVVAALLVLTGKGDRLRYTYDFGDDWEHEILVEEALGAEPDAPYPLCLAGKGACPPEDCGGVWGYGHLREVLADPAHEEHEDMLEWLGLDSGSEFDPASFDVEEVNEALGSVVRRTGEPGRRSVAASAAMLGEWRIRRPCITAMGVAPSPLTSSSPGFRPSPPRRSTTTSRSI